MLITETHLTQWADRHECRCNLPILVRRLIRETCPSLSSLRFPGNDAVDLAGFDGEAVVEIASTWVQQGRSVWEMGCNKGPEAKANSDFTKRTSEIPPGEREVTSFVFVTPRRWGGKSDWSAQRRQENAWAAVSAYDAVDLETWLEEAPVTSRWLAELLGIADPSLMTPHEWWQQWATVATPAISVHLVASRRHEEQKKLLQKLRDSEHVISIQADDRKEAVAFVIATMIETNALDLLDRTLVAKSGNARMTAGLTPQIIITDVAEGDEVDFGNRRNFIIVRPYPKGRFDVRDALQLSHVPSDVFRSELTA